MDCLGHDHRHEQFCRHTIEKREKIKKRKQNGLSGRDAKGPLLSSGDEDSDDDEDRRPDVRRRILSMNESSEEPRDFQLSDVFEFIQKGVHDIVDDEVTKRFDAEELPSWNLLTRTNKNYQFVSWKLTVYWLIGFVIRFYMLLPIRFAIFAFGN